MSLPDHSVEILLIEDSPEDAALTLRALARYRLANSVHVARDGAEALDYLRGPVQPRVIMLDLKLPKVNGLEVLSFIKQDPRLRAVPVVVLTSSAEEPDIAKAYALGANSYIVKPVDFDQFVKAVSETGLYWLLLNRAPLGQTHG